MYEREIRKADVATLVNTYGRAAAAHGLASTDGDAARADPLAGLLADLYHELRRRGEDAQEQLLALLDDANPHVRVWVASHALEFAPERCEAALEEVIAEAGEGQQVAHDARWTLDAWRAGHLEFP